MEKTRYPDFFIVGAPKCGTTALAAYLEQSENINFHRKEIHYFGKDLEFNRPRVNLDDYLAYSQSFPKDNLLGDASVYYLFSKTAAKEIYDINPNAKIIICLRNPIDFVQSLHAQLVSNADENELDLETALELEESRLNGKNVPWYAHPVHALRYTEMAKFSGQVKRYLEIFPKENVKVVFLEELSKDANSVTQSVFSFLGMEPPSELSLNVVNPTTTVRFKWVKVFHKTVLPADGRVRKIVPKFFLRPIDFILFRIMSKKATKRVMSQSLRLRLREKLSEDVLKLRSVLGNELSVWKDFISG